MKKPKASKRAAGKRLNDQGRESPLEVFQLRMEHYSKLARDEINKGVLGSREKTDEYLRLAQEAGEALAPYRHARLTPTDATTAAATTKVLRVGPVEQFKTPEEWLRAYSDPAEQIRDAEKVDQFLDRARGGVPIEVPDVPKNELN